MSLKPGISGQLRRRRAELGLSLADVARRAGTSAATLSRYENGWTRFETYTLRKLAMALECDLAIEFRPTAREKQKAPDSRAVCIQLQRLFWDHVLEPKDFDAHLVWVVERVLDYGALEDIHALRAVVGKRVFLRAVAGADRVSPRTRAFWRQILKLEGIPCTKKSFRNTAWIS